MRLPHLRSAFYIALLAALFAWSCGSETPTDPSDLPEQPVDSNGTSEMDWSCWDCVYVPEGSFEPESVVVRMLPDVDSTGAVFLRRHEFATAYTWWYSRTSGFSPWMRSNDYLFAIARDSTSETFAEIDSLAQSRGHQMRRSDSRFGDGRRLSIVLPNDYDWLDAAFPYIDEVDFYLSHADLFEVFYPAITIQHD